MEKIMSLYSFVVDHGAEVSAILLALIALAQMITALTPTKTDDLAIERFGKYVRKILEFLKVPNVKSGGGTHPTLKEKSKGSENA